MFGKWFCLFEEGGELGGSAAIAELRAQGQEQRGNESSRAGAMRTVQCGRLCSYHASPQRRAVLAPWGLGARWEERLQFCRPSCRSPTLHSTAGLQRNRLEYASTLSSSPLAPSHPD